MESLLQLDAVVCKNEMTGKTKSWLQAYTDVLTAEGYTVTCPTAYEPPRESEDFDHLSYHSFAGDYD